MRRGLLSVLHVMVSVTVQAVAGALAFLSAIAAAIRASATAGSRWEPQTTLKVSDGTPESTNTRSGSTSAVLPGSRLGRYAMCATRLASSPPAAPPRAARRTRLSTRWARSVPLPSRARMNHERAGDKAIS
jgi:hypothetical protein